MQVSVKKTVTIEPEFIRVVVPVRYGEEDIPKDFPLRSGDTWSATIRISDGKIIEWPAGQQEERTIEMKVVDEGSYYLLDANKEEIAKREQDYVPGCIPNSYGDYIDFRIAPDGTVADWRGHCTEDNIRESFFGDDD